MRLTEEHLLALGYPHDMLDSAKSGKAQPKRLDSVVGVKVLVNRLAIGGSHRSYEPGETIVEFRVDVRPVPWSVSHRGKKSPKLSEFQRAIHAAASAAMGDRLAYAGPVELHAAFWLVRPRSGTPPDLTNLEKGAEDALQVLAADRSLSALAPGVILNDSQVRAKRTEYDPDATVNGAWIRILAYKPDWSFVP